MTHRLACDPHTWTAWSTAERPNEAGERMFVFQRECTICHHVDEERGAIVEEQPGRFYAKTQEEHSEPDD